MNPFATTLFVLIGAFLLGIKLAVELFSLLSGEQLNGGRNLRNRTYA